MRWRAGQIRYYDVWEQWFAWFPVKIGGELVWMETIQRTQKAPFDPLFVHPLYVVPWTYRMSSEI